MTSAATGKIIIPVGISPRETVRIILKKRHVLKDQDNVFVSEIYRSNEFPFSLSNGVKGTISIFPLHAKDGGLLHNYQVEFQENDRPEALFLRGPF